MKLDICSKMCCGPVEAEVLTALQVQAKNTAAVDMSGYEFLLAHLQELTKVAKESFERWKRWALHEQNQDTQDRLNDLNQKIPVLVSRKADFQKLKEEQHQVTPISQHRLVPAVRLNCSSQVHWQQV